MKEFMYEIHDPLGLHARPAGILSRAAAGFQSEIRLVYKEQSVLLRRMIGVISLQVKQGEQVKIQADGDDEEAAIAQLQTVCQESL